MAVEVVIDFAAGRRTQTKEEGLGLPMHIGRRRLLGTGGAALLAGLATPAVGGPISVGAALLSASQQRELSFDNIHTGEKLSIEYWANGGYVAGALTTINHLLRDFRNN